MGKSFYTYGSAVSVTDNPQKLFSLLYYRTIDFCDVYSFETNEEAHIYSMQQNCYYGYGWLGSRGPMKLPLSGEYFIQNPNIGEMFSMTEETTLDGIKPLYSVASDQNALQSPRTEIWAVDFINGFAVVDDLNSLMDILENYEYIYAHARWLQNIDQALKVAKISYIRRFYARYDARTERLVLPEDTKTMIFIDPYFSDREERFKLNQSMHILHTYGIF